MAPQINGDPSPSLADVTLVRFRAQPADLKPFEAALLSWEVTAPAGVTIELSGTPVAKAGSQSVEPASTAIYSLTAKTRGSPVRGGGAIEVLGNIVVTVHLSQCRMGELLFLDAFIRAGILSHSDTLPSGTQFREDPRVTVTPGQIQIHLSLYKVMSSLMYWIDIDMSFGLTLAPDTRVSAKWGRGLGVSAVGPRVATRLASMNASYSVSVTPPFYVSIFEWITDSNAVAMAEDSVRSKVPGIIQSVVDGLDALYHPEGTEGLQKHSVTIGVDEKNSPFLDGLWCPPPDELVVKSVL